MLYYHHISENNAELGIWKIEESADDLLSLLSAETLSNKRYKSITNPSRILEWLSVRVLLKTLCKEEKIVLYSESGKPYLQDKSFNISISHTKNYVAVLLHPEKEVGIDIEFQSDRAYKLKERYMHESELENIDSENSITHALLHWSAKETLFKILPESDFDFIKHLRILPFKLETSGQFKGIEYRTTNELEFDIEYSVFQDFVLTWALFSKNI